MKICVLGDIHNKNLPDKLIEKIKSSDLVIGTGDFAEINIVKKIEKLSKKFIAVYGNLDSEEVRKVLPEVRVFEITKRKVGLYHGNGSPLWIEKRVLARLRKESKEHFDIIFFGHSHHATNKIIDKTLFFNPGSPTDIIFAPYKSFGIVEINKKTGKIKARIVRV